MGVDIQKAPLGVFGYLRASRARADEIGLPEILRAKVNQQTRPFTLLSL